MICPKCGTQFVIARTGVVKAARNVDNKWGKVTITNIPDYERYRNSWGLIADHLGVPTKAKTLAGMDAASG